MKSLISFIVCSYNAPELITKCINSILRQKYSGKKQILIVDGGSDEATLNVIENMHKRHGEITLIKNKNKLPEGYGMGKWLGWKKADGNYVFIIDQDNELEGDNCVNEMLMPFEKKDVFGCLCRVKTDYNDNLTNQYVSFMGTDPFLAYRTVDILISLKKIEEDYGKYSLVRISPKNILITGGNCFVYKKKYLDSIGGYIQDTQNVMNLVNKGYDCVAIAKNAHTHHRATKGFFDFIKKKQKWAKTYNFSVEKTNKFSYMPSTKIQRKEFILNLFFIATFFPTLVIAMKKIIETREKAWILHPILSFITLFIYSYHFAIENFLKFSKK